MEWDRNTLRMETFISDNSRVEYLKEKVSSRMIVKRIGSTDHLKMAIYAI